LKVPIQFSKRQRYLLLQVIRYAANSEIVGQKRAEEAFTLWLASLPLPDVLTVSDAIQSLNEAAPDDRRLAYHDLLSQPGVPYPPGGVIDEMSNILAESIVP
jgi:hypothetical protein